MEMDAQTRERFERLIRERLADLDAEDEATAEDREPVELDQQQMGRLSRMDAMQAQERAKAHARRRQSERQRLHSALRRMADDEYGDCDVCGEPIAAKRLELDPAVTRCIDCASD
jgi:DnaK suppressor protein